MIATHAILKKITGTDIESTLIIFYFPSHPVPG